MLTRNAALAALIGLVLIACAGCGGGGGGVASQTLSLAVEEPDVVGAQGEDIDLAVDVTGSGSVQSAEFNIVLNGDVLNPSGTLAGDDSSLSVTGLPQGTVCRYKWVDENTIRVLFASSTGVAAGSVLARIPVYVAAEGQPGVSVEIVSLNE